METHSIKLTVTLPTPVWHELQAFPAAPERASKDRSAAMAALGELVVAAAKRTVGGRERGGTAR